jgi:hypothetical protein
MDRAAILSDFATVRPEHLMLDPQSAQPVAAADGGLRTEMGDFERERSCPLLRA